MGVILKILKSNSFGLAILACAAVSFAFPAAFTSWGGVKLTKLVTPAIQIIMFGMGTTLTLADFVRVAKCPWAVATGVFLQFLVMPLVGYSLALATDVLKSAVAALPANVFSIWMNFSGSLVANGWSRRPVAVGTATTKGVM